MTAKRKGRLVPASAALTASNIRLHSNTTADRLLSRLNGVRQTGPGRWIALCPAHEDRSPSLSVRELDDGRTLLKCFASCSASDVLAAVGLEFSDLFPDKLPEHGERERRPFPAADVLRCIAFEALVVAVAGAAMWAGQPFTDVDRDRLMVAVSRIREAARIAGVMDGN